MIEIEASPAVTLAERAVELGAQQKIGELNMLIDFLCGRFALPGTALEIGSMVGGSLWLWAQIFYLTVSIDVLTVPTGHINHGRRVITLCGDSHDPLIRRSAGDWSYDFIFLDGDHTYEGVCLDYEVYSTMLAPGGVIVFHDIVEHQPETGCEVHRFWEEIKAERKTLEFISPVEQRVRYGVLPVDSCGIGVIL